MCGRAAQTYHAARLGAKMLGSSSRALDPFEEAGQDNSSNRQDQKKGAQQQQSKERNNFNMSPGMDAWVMYLDENKKMKIDKKVWGLVTEAGTSTKPLPSDERSRMSLHFSNLMFNARSDTLYSKPTFARLAAAGKSCLIALDGYFEWKESPLSVKKKQPYFVHAHRDNDDKEEHPTRHCLLVAGLWTKVATGLPDNPELDTFTMVTTESNKQISWLHTRMPLCINGDDNSVRLGRQWLENPSSKVLNLIDDQAHQKNNDMYGWYMVTTEMSNLKYRDKAAIKALPPPRSVASFFGKRKEVVSPPKANEKTTKRKVEDKSSMLHYAKKPRQSTTTGVNLNLSSKNSAEMAYKISTNVNLKPKQNSPATKVKPPDGIKSPEKGLITSFFQKAAK